MKQDHFHPKMTDLPSGHERSAMFRPGTYMLMVSARISTIDVSLLDDDFDRFCMAVPCGPLECCLALNRFFVRNYPFGRARATTQTSMTAHSCKVRMHPMYGRVGDVLLRSSFESGAHILAVSIQCNSRCGSHCRYHYDQIN